MVFSYSLSAKSSSPRVATWRQLQRLGAISVAGGVYLLPATDECEEAFQWLAQKVRHADGEALVMRVVNFGDVTEQQIVALFNQARRENYATVDAQVDTLEGALRQHTEDLEGFRDEISRLQQAQAVVARIDYFGCPEGVLLVSRLERIRASFFPDGSAAAEIPRASPEAYAGKVWVTRPHPHVDRLACIWLIRRFIDPGAVVRYALQAGPDEISFDVEESQFGHQGDLCTFEVMVAAFGLDQPGMRALAEIVHEIDLREGRFTRPEVGGIDTLLRGWQLSGIDDADMEARGIALFEGMHAALSVISQSPGRERT
ncbi:MAG: chromate resistance protein [Anaerolineae bacterium]|nr:chromate resistance protein [Anaerolineae bacterium]